MLRSAKPAALTLVLALVGGLIGGLLVAAPARATSVATDVKVRALYYQRIGAAADRQASVDAIASASELEGKLWTDFFASWDALNAKVEIQTQLPGGLPEAGHVFVVLGSALKSSGAIPAKLERRLKLALEALAAYPNSHVLVTGGAPKNGVTEAAAMRAWLLAKGVAEDRILVEAKASSTVSNARNSVSLLQARPQYTTYTLISDASHIRRASVLFEAAEVVAASRSGAAMNLTAIANFAYPDKAITPKASAATRSVISANVASVFGVLAAYNKLLSSPPKTVVLTGLKLTPPTRLAYAVGQGLDASGLVVTATYNVAGYTRVVTGKAKITGFDSAATGKPKVTVSYTENGVTKKAVFATKVAKAASGIELAASKTTLKLRRTKATLSVKVVSATGVIPTGKVKVYLDGKRLAKPQLTASGTANFKLPALKKTGKHTVKVTYDGDAGLKSSAKTLTLKVKK